MESPPPARKTRWQLAYASGALGTQVVFGVAPAFLPLLLERHLGATPLVVGAILGLAPAAGLITLPLVNRPGPRLPYMLTAIPLTAVPLAALAGVGSAAVGAGLVATAYVGVNVFLGPYRASLGEEVEPRHWLRVSGMQTAFKGLGTLLVLTGGGVLFQRSDGWPFVATAGVFAACAAMACLAMRLGRRPAAPASPVHAGALREAARGLEVLLVAHVLWWFAFQAVFAFTIPFLVHDVAGVKDANSAAGLAAAAGAVPVLTAFALVAMLSAAPVVQLAERFGPRRVLVVGLVGSAAAVAWAVAADSTGSAYLFALFGGVGYACVQALSYPLMLAWRRHGTEGGLAALFEGGVDLAQLLAVIALGGLASWLGGYRGVFVAAALAWLVACAVLSVAPEAPPARPDVAEAG